MHTGTNQNYKIRRAVFYNLFSSLCASIAVVLVKYAFANSSCSQILFFRSFLSFICVVAMILATPKSSSYSTFLKTPFLPLHIARTVTALASLYLFSWALQISSITEVTLLSSTLPFFAPFIAYLWKRTPINHKIWPNITIGFLGVALLTHPEHTGGGWGVSLALSGSLLGAISFVALRFAGHYKEPIQRTLFYYTLLSSIISGIIYYFSGFSLVDLMDAKKILLLSSVGILGFLYQYFFALSLEYAPAFLIGPLSYFCIVFSLLFDILFFHRQLLFTELVGIITITLGLGLMVVLTQAQKQPKKQ